MKILIDADGCPVTDIVVKVARDHKINCIILCDTSHQIEKPGVKTITVDKGADSVDFALVNLLNKGDIVITQDYGLAAISLARGAAALDQNGREYTGENIDALLLARHTAKKIRISGGRLKGAKKRQPVINEEFKKALEELIKNTNK